MKLCRYGPKGGEKPGLVDADGHLRGLSGLIDDLTPATLEVVERLRTIDPGTLPLVDGEQRQRVVAFDLKALA